MSTGMIWQTDSTSSADTERLGELLGDLIHPPMAIELVGDLGAGKTSFVRGLVQGSGGGDTATSPSFSLSNIYEIDDRKIHHFDLYRLGNNPGVIKDQLAEALAEPESVVVVEWGRSVVNLLPEDTISIKFSSDPDNSDKRYIELRYSSPQEDLITKLETLWRESRP